MVMVVVILEFRIPDYRGVFIRGLDSGRGLDNGRILGSYQMDADQRIEGMFGIVTTQKHGITTTGPFYANYRDNGDEGSEYNEGWDVYFDSSRVVRTANESRPKNQSLLIIIKVKTV